MELKGFITNLGKYNEGELIGKWVQFPITEEEQEQIFSEIGIDEIYEEFFFTDWECAADLNLGEYEDIDHINELAEQMEDWDEDVFKAAVEIWGHREVMEHTSDEYNLYSDITNDYDLGYYWVVESGCYDLRNMGTLANYIDYEAFGRDVALETNGGFTSYGFIEYVG